VSRRPSALPTLPKGGLLRLNRKAAPDTTARQCNIAAFTTRNSGIIKFYPILHPTRVGYALQAIDFIGRTTYCQVQLVNGVAHCPSRAMTGSATEAGQSRRVGDQQHADRSRGSGHPSRTAVLPGPYPGRLGGDSAAKADH
jgi:hypothetical protein